MRRAVEHRRDIDRRTLLLGAAELALLTGLGGRLYYLQIQKSDLYKTLAEGNRVRLFPVLPDRGRVLDRNGVVLADSIPRYQLWLDAGNAEQAENVLAALKDILAIPDEEMRKVKEKLKEAPGEPLLVKDYLDWSALSAIEVRAPDLPGAQVETSHVRHYPLGGATVHAVGYVGAVTKEEMESSPLYRHPNFRIGKTGIEKALERRLRGKPGVKRVEVDALGNRVQELSIEESISGTETLLTLDAELQAFAMQRMAGLGGLERESGAAVLLDAVNGEVLAMASVPAFDPHQMVRGMTPAAWQALTRDPDVPLINKTIGVRYPPGSTFKLVVALAALEAGVINRNTRFYCPGHYVFGGRRFHCWERKGHGHVTVLEGIAKSCNVFFYNVSQSVGVDRIAAMARKLGLGDVTGVGLTGEKPGLIPDRAWKRKALKAPWYPGETLSVGIGQGYVLATPLQLALMSARIASGRKVEPHLVQEREEREATFPALELSAASMNLLRECMNRVVNHRSGIGYNVRIPEVGFEMAGKTGTVQTHEKTYEFLPKERKLRYHAVFVGYAPVHAPRYAAAVIIEHGGFGGQVAAPVARDLLRKVQGLKVLKV